MLDKNPILETISNWFSRTFSDPAAISLFFTIILGFLVLEFFGKLLMPVFVSVVIAYLLQAVVKLFKKWKVPHLLAVIIAFSLFIGFIIVSLFILLPMLWKQLSNLMSELPHAVNKGQVLFSNFMHNHPRIFSGDQLQRAVGFFQEQSSKIGQLALRYSIATIPSVLQAIVYFVLVPLLVFFFLKDQDKILAWFSQYMPSNRSLVLSVWSEVNEKIGAYVRGRVMEIFIVGIVSGAAFIILNLNYAQLLGALVGLSVLIPYVGAVIVTIPIVVVALLQWGISAHFTYLIAVYALIILLDGNILAPLLLSETVRLHPIVIILAVVIFGAIWGFWGVFFAIPLATLVNAVLKAWPRQDGGGG